MAMVKKQPRTSKTIIERATMMKKLALLLVVTICGMVGLLSSLTAGGADEPAPEGLTKKGICVIQPLGGSKVEGVVTFTQRDGFVEVSARVTGLAPGLHGFHIHEFGDCSMADGTRR